MSVEYEGSSKATEEISDENENIVATALPDATAVKVTFTSQAYLASITLSYNEPEVEYPGTPTDVSATDRTWDLTSLDASTSAFEKARGEVDGLLVDATNGKFAPRAGDTQVNTGTVIYVPVAQDDQGATLTISGSINDGNVTVDGESLPADGRVELVCNETEYVAIRFDAAEGAGAVSNFLTGITIDYASDTQTYPGFPSEVAAQDTTWNLASDAVVVRPKDVNGARADWEGIRIDALQGKFSARSNDTQVNAGTILYIPIAQSEGAVTLRLEGNNYNNLDVTVDDAPASLGSDITVDASTTRYVKVAFSSADGEGSCYLTSIALDYELDNDEAYHVVTVGSNGMYQSINAALAAEESSLNDHLVLSIAPGSYHERVVVDKPGVIFQNADASGERAVVIHEAYYSSNTFEEDGTFVPQDDHDKGTAQCGTVTVTSSGTGFTAYGITFQNDYNVTIHTTENTQTPAVAFDSKADRVNLQNCSFIGRQDTVYLEGAGNRVYMSDCYIEGTVDFIFGNADAYITNSSIHMAAFPGRTVGYFTAANTKAGNTGLVFVGCTLTADESVTDVSLGRPWQNLAYYTGTHVDSEGHTIYDGFDKTQPHPDYADVSSAVTFIGCTMPANLKPEHWNYWAGRTEDNGTTHSITYEKTVRFKEIGCTYPGGAPDESRLVLGGEGEFVAASDQTTIDEATSSALASMNWGAWNPVSFGRIDDAAAWDGQVPQGPTGTTGITGTGGSIGTGGATGASGAAGTTNNTTSDDADANAGALAQLPATGDSTAAVLAAVVAAGAALCGAGVVLRKRGER